MNASENKAASNWPFTCQIVDKGEDPKDHPMHTCPKCLKGIDLGDGKGLREVTES